MFWREPQSGIYRCDETKSTMRLNQQTIGYTYICSDLILVASYCLVFYWTSGENVETSLTSYKTCGMLLQLAYCEVHFIDQLLYYKVYMQV